MTARLALLLLLAGWSALLSLESWVRRPGDVHGLGLPERLVRQGRAYVRQGTLDPAQASEQGPGLVRPPASQPVAGLPPGLVLLNIAHYRREAAGPNGPAEIRLLHLVHTRSGRSGVMPVEALTHALAAPGGDGRCIVPAADGGIAHELFTAADWRLWQRSRAVSWRHRLAWLAGLRPFADNSCLWESLPGPPVVQPSQ